jgi:hypothetical protein
VRLVVLLAAYFCLTSTNGCHGAPRHPWAGPIAHGVRELQLLQHLVVTHSGCKLQLLVPKKAIRAVVGRGHRVVGDNRVANPWNRLATGATQAARAIEHRRALSCGRRGAAGTDIAMSIVQGVRLGLPPAGRGHMGLCSMSGSGPCAMCRRGRGRMAGVWSRWRWRGGWCLPGGCGAWPLVAAGGTAGAWDLGPCRWRVGGGLGLGPWSCLPSLGVWCAECASG